MSSTHLCIAHCSLDRGRAFHGHMTEIVGNLFKDPSCCPGTMCEIMAKIMEGEIGKETLLFFGGPALDTTKPMMDATLSKLGIALRCEGVEALPVAAAMLK